MAARIRRPSRSCGGRPRWGGPGLRGRRGRRTRPPPPRLRSGPPRSGSDTAVTAASETPSRGGPSQLENTAVRVARQPMATRPAAASQVSRSGASEESTRASPASLRSFQGNTSSRRRPAGGGRTRPARGGSPPRGRGSADTALLGQGDDGVGHGPVDELEVAGVDRHRIGHQPGEEPVVEARRHELEGGSRRPGGGGGRRPRRRPPARRPPSRGSPPADPGGRRR